MDNQQEAEGASVIHIGWSANLISVIWGGFYFIGGMQSWCRLSVCTAYDDKGVVLTENSLKGSATFLCTGKYFNLCDSSVCPQSLMLK